MEEKTKKSYDVKIESVVIPMKVKKITGKRTLDDKPFTMYLMSVSYDNKYDNEVVFKTSNKWDQWKLSKLYKLGEDLKTTNIYNNGAFTNNELVDIETFVKGTTK